MSQAWQWQSKLLICYMVMALSGCSSGRELAGREILGSGEVEFQGLYVGRYVIIHTSDGRQIAGVIAELEEEWVYVESDGSLEQTSVLIKEIETVTLIKESRVGSFLVLGGMAAHVLFWGTFRIFM